MQGGRDGELVVMFGGATTGEPRMTALGDTWVLAASHGNRWYPKKFNATIIPGTTIGVKIMNFHQKHKRTYIKNVKICIKNENFVSKTSNFA